VYFAASAHFDKCGAVFALNPEPFRPKGPKDRRHQVYNSGRREEGWDIHNQHFREGIPPTLHVCTTTDTPVRLAVQEGYFTTCTNILEDQWKVIHLEFPGALQRYIIRREDKPLLFKEACIHGYSGSALFSDSTERAGYTQRDEVIRSLRENKKKSSAATTH
jgi:hypothetical protein